MSKKLQGIIVGFLLGSILTGSFAFAKTGVEYIRAAYRDIKIYVNGTQINPKDTTGRPIEAFISNSTTYLPVRAVAEALGENVSWDDKTSSVYIGGTPTTSQNWMDQCKPYQYQLGYEYLPSANKTFSMSGKEYNKGFTLYGSDLDTGSFALFNLGGKYNSCSFKVGLVNGPDVRDAILNIYLDGNLVKTVNIKGDASAQTINLQLNNAKEMKLQIKLDGPRYYYNCHYGFADGVFK